MTASSRKIGCFLLLAGLALPAFAKSGNAPLTPIARGAPAYPTAAARKGYEGAVNVCFTVLTNGQVGNVRVKDFKLTAPTPADAPPSATVVQQARKLLGDAAVAAAQQDKFSPAKRDGNPVETKNVCQQYTFKNPVSPTPSTASAPPTTTAHESPPKPMLAVRVPFPFGAERKGYKGILTLCFTVLKDGRTADAHVAHFKLTAPLPKDAPPSATKVAEARTLFGQAVLSKFRDYRFFPKKIDGQAVDTENVCETFPFTRHRATAPSMISTPPSSSSVANS